MARDNFANCLQVALEWENNYSHHADNPGSDVIKGVTQVNYDVYRGLNGQLPLPVKDISDLELGVLYKNGFWLTMGCDDLAPGYDLCVFDAAINATIERAKEWENGNETIDSYCDAWLNYLKTLGRVWEVFGLGWQEHVNSIREAAHEMADTYAKEQSEKYAITYHAGMTNDDIKEMQGSLMSLGYPIHRAHGIFDGNTHASVTLFQMSNKLPVSGTWGPPEKDALKKAKPYIK